MKEQVEDIEEWRGPFERHLEVYVENGKTKVRQKTPTVKVDTYVVAIYNFYRNIEQFDINDKYVYKDHRLFYVKNIINGYVIGNDIKIEHTPNKLDTTWSNDIVLKIDDYFFDTINVGLSIYTKSEKHDQFGITFSLDNYRVLSFNNNIIELHLFHDPSIKHFINVIAKTKVKIAFQPDRYYNINECYCIDSYIGDYSSSLKFRIPWENKVKDHWLA